MRRNIVRLILVAAIGGLAYLLSFLGLGPWGGGGKDGAGPSAKRPAATQPSVAATQPAPTQLAQTQPAQTQPAPPELKRPLEIVIDDRSYLVGGKAVNLAEIERMIGRIPDGPGPAVIVNRRPSSRAETEVALRLKLEDLKVTSGWSPPLQ